MKKCGKCGLDKEDSEFVIKNKKTGRLESYCKLCHSKYHLQWYKENRIARRKQITDRRRGLAEFLKDIKKI